MKKVEIVEEKKEEKNNSQVYEIKVDNEGTRLGALASLILTTLYFCYEIFTGKGRNPAFYSIITMFCAVSYGYKAFKIEKDRKTNIIVSIIWSILTITLIIDYFAGK